MSEKRCGAVEPAGLVGYARCERDAGHDGRHRATRSVDGWDCSAEWRQRRCGAVLSDGSRCTRPVGHLSESHFSVDAELTRDEAAALYAEHVLALKLAEDDGVDWVTLSDAEVEAYYAVARGRLTHGTMPGAGEESKP